jgi:hypothetical protein
MPRYDSIIMLGRKKEERKQERRDMIYITLSSVCPVLNSHRLHCPYTLIVCRGVACTFLSLSAVVNSFRIALISLKKKGDHEKEFLCERQDINMRHSFARKKAWVSFCSLNSECHYRVLRYWTMLYWPVCALFVKCTKCLVDANMQNDR